MYNRTNERENFSFEEINEKEAIISRLERRRDRLSEMLDELLVESTINRLCECKKAKISKEMKKIGRKLQDTDIAIGILKNSSDDELDELKEETFIISKLSILVRI